MVRVMVVDDEIMQREALSVMLKKYVNEVGEVELAANGREALLKMDERPADIVCIDYRMPGLTGVEVIEEIKKKYPKTVFILVTAYGEFDIAQKAMKLLVRDYLLKPVKRAEFTELITTCIKEITAEKDRNNEVLSLKEYVRELLPTFEKELFCALLLNDADVIGRFFEMQNISTDAPGFCAVVKAVSDEVSTATVIDAVKFRSVGCYVLARQSVDTSVTLFVIKTTEDGDLKNLKIALQRELGDKFTVSFGKTVKGAHRLNESYKQALSGSHDDVDDSGGNKIGGEYPYDIEKQILIAITGKNPDKATQLIAELYHRVISYCLGDRDNVYSEMQKLQVTLLKLCSEYNVEVTDPPGGAEYINDSCVNIARSLVAAFSNKNGGKDEIISGVIKYINENYFRNIGLEDIANEFNISVFYFTKRFKANMGYTFVEYLTYIRIENAKKLLIEDPDIEIKEVCELVGYNDPKYFCKAFKKMTGLTPTEFRKK